MNGHERILLVQQAVSKSPKEGKQLVACPDFNGKVITTFEGNIMSRRNCMCILLFQQVSYWFTQIHGWMIVLSMGHPVFNIGMCWTKVKMTCWWIIGINLQVLHAKCTDATLKKNWFTGSVVLNSPFLKKCTVVSRRPRESAQQTFIWHCLKRWFIGCSGFRLSLISETPICKWLPLSNKACKVRIFRRKKSKPTAMNYNRESEIQSNHSFRLRKELVNLGWNFQPDTLELIVSWASSPSVPCIHSSTRIRCSMASHSHNGKPTSIQRLDHMFRCNLKVTWWIGSPVDMFVLFRDGWWCELNLDHEHLSMINGIRYMHIYIYICTYMIYRCVLEIGNCWRGSILKTYFQRAIWVCAWSFWTAFFTQSIAGSKNCQDFDECPLGHH